MIEARSQSSHSLTIPITLGLNAPNGPPQRRQHADLHSAINPTEADSPQTTMHHPNNPRSLTRWSPNRMGQILIAIELLQA
jgi:hypothetical protein